MDLVDGLIDWSIYLFFFSWDKELDMTKSEAIAMKKKQKKLD